MTSVLRFLILVWRPGTVTFLVVVSAVFGLPLCVRGQLATQPTVQASAIVFSNNGGESVTVNFTNGNGTSRLLVARAGSAVDATPVDGVAYTAGSCFGSGSQIGTGNYVVGVGSGPFTVGCVVTTGTYHFRVFEFNGTTTGTQNYNIATATNNPRSVIILEAEPTQQTTGIVFSNLGPTSVTVDFTEGNGYSRTVVARAGSAVNADPVDGVGYVFNNVFGSGAQVGSGNYVVGAGNGPMTITGLTLGETYYFRVYEFNGATSSVRNYKTTTTATNPKSVSTIASEPTVGATNITFSNLSTNSLTLNFYNGNGTSRLVVAKQNSPVNAVPADGTSYTANNTFGSGSQIGSGNFVVGMGSDPITVSGLAAGTSYHFAIFEFNGTGTTSNYLTSMTDNVASRYTLTTAPNESPTNIQFNDPDPASFNVSFTPVTGATGYIALRRLHYDCSTCDWGPCCVCAPPYDGSTFSVGTMLYASCGEGSGGPSAVVVYKGTLTSFQDTDVPPASLNEYAIFAYNEVNGIAQTTNYTDEYLYGIGQALDVEPVNQPVNFSATPFSNTQINLSFPAATTISSADGYIIVRRQDGSNPTTQGITDGAIPGALPLAPGTTLVAHIQSSATTSYEDAGLVVNTQYNYLIIPYNFDGGNAETYNYKTDGTLRTALTVPTYSSSSDIIAASFVYMSNIAHTSFLASDLTAANSLAIGEFTIRDGGAANDTDDASTLLSDISFSISNGSLLSRVALYDGSIELGETSPVGNSISFAGLTGLIAPDNGSKTFLLRVSFKSIVTDNEQIAFAVSFVTSPSTGSNFNSLNAGGAATSTAGDNNRIEVTAQAIDFATQPDMMILVATNVPTVIVNAVDAFGNVDIDYTASATVTNSATLNVVNPPSFFSSGFLTWPDNFQFTSHGVTSITVESGLLAAGESNQFIVRAAEPIVQPAVTVFSSVTVNSMSVSFTPANDVPDGYFVLMRPGISPTDVPVDGVEYSVGSTLGPSTVTHVGSGTTFNVTGLNPNIVYYFDIFAYNGTAESTNYLTTLPLEGNRATLYSEPLSQAAGFSLSVPGVNSLTVSWTNGTGSERLLLAAAGATLMEAPVDGISYQGNADFGSAPDIGNGHKVLYRGAGFSVAVTGLNAGTIYSFKVFELNGMGAQTNYLTLDNTANPATSATLAVEPANQPSGPLTFTNVTQSSLTVSFASASGNPDGYLSVRRAGTPSVDAPVDGIEYVENRAIGSGTVVHLGNATAFDDSGLTPSTTYYYSIYAYNGTTGTYNYLTTSPLTGNQQTSQPGEFKINPPVYDVKFSEGGKVSVEVTGPSGPLTVTMKARKITDTDFTPYATSLKTGTTTFFDVAITNAMADELGTEFYFEAYDGVSTIRHPSNYFIYKSISASSNQAIAFAPGFNGKTNTYQMFSLPYELAAKEVDKLFDVALDGYDDTRWRLFHFQNNSYREYPNQFKEIKLGEGYWFNTKINDFQITLGDATVAQAHQNAPFTKTLEAGWNQIGNPYPFNLDWNAVVGANDKVGPLWFFSNGSYSKSNVFKPWTGAFVHADEAIILSIPVLAKTTASGGRTSDHATETDLDAAAWLLPVILRINDLQQVSGVGMHPEAKPSKDKFDEITLPRFLDYVEMNTYHKEFFSPYFSTDVVPTGEEQTWIFDVKSNLDAQQGELLWDHTSIATNKSSLILIDLLDGKWIDMKTTGSYAFTHREGRQFRIVYNREGEMRPGVTLVGEAYPNPFVSEVTFPVLVDEPGYKQITVYDGIGRKVKIIGKEFDKPGLHEITWDLKDDSGSEVSSGLMFYRMEEGLNRQVKRIVRR